MRERSPAAPAAPAAPPEPGDPVDGDRDRDDLSLLPSLSSLPILAGLSRRRLGFLAAGLVTAWIVVAFARQVGEASAATARLDGLEASNTSLAGQVSALQREYQLIQTQAWISQQARAYGLGGRRDVPFALAAGAPSLAPDAAGSAAVRLGAEPDTRTPLESWLTLLFGPSP
jgi:cell division protein FtsB